PKLLNRLPTPRKIIWRTDGSLALAMMSVSTTSELLQVIACPLDHSTLQAESGYLDCRNGHRFAVECGISVLTESPRRELGPRDMEACRRDNEQSRIHPSFDG